VHRFFVPPQDCSERQIQLPEREAHHAARVLRLQRGERVIVLNGCGEQFVCEATNLDRHSVRLEVRSKTQAAAAPGRLTLLQALTKSKSFELILQKATELGVARIVPVLSARIVPQIGNAENKLEKWKQILIEAMKQSGSPWLPEITSPSTPADFLAKKEVVDLALVAALTGERRQPRYWFDDFEKSHRRAPTSLCAWVGPEGDFTEDELAIVLGAGAKPITLGPQVLRAETAAIYCLSVLSYELMTRNAE